MAQSKRVNIKYTVDARGAKRGLDSLSKSTEMVRKSTVKSSTSFQQFGGVLKGVNSGASGAIASLGKLAGVAGATAAAAVALFEALDATANRAFKANAAFNNIPFSLENAQRATKGLVDDLTLAQLAFTANQFGVAKTSEEFGKLTDAAVKLGLAQGVDAKQSVEDLTRGIARQSSAILDNLGIIVKADDAYAAYADTTGKLVSELTSAERKQAFTNAALKAASEAASTVNDDVGALALTWKQLGVELENFANSSAVFASDTIDVLAGAVNNLTDAFTGANSAANIAARTQLEKIRATRAAAAKEEQAEVRRRLDLNQQEIDQRKEVVSLLEIELARGEGLTGSAEDQAALKEDIARTELEILDIQRQRAVIQGRSDEESLKTALERAKLENQIARAQESVIKRAPSRRRSRRAEPQDPFASERAAFQEQLTDTINAQRRREFSEATSLQRGYLASVRTFENEIENIRLGSFNRSQQTAEQERKLGEIRFAENARILEQEVARATTEQERFLLQQEAFFAKEAALTKEIELATRVDDINRLKDEREAVMHQATLSRIQQERVAREQQQQALINGITTSNQVFGQAAAFSSELASAQIADEERRQRVVNGIKAADIVADGIGYQVKAIGAFASGNIVQGIALQAAAAFAFAKAPLVASGNLSSGGGGGGSVGTNTRFSPGEGGGAPQPSRTSLDRGGPISVQDEIDQNPNNTSSQGRTSSQGNVVNINKIDVLGSIDDESATKIKRGLSKASAGFEN